MRYRLPPWVVLALLALICGAMIAGVAWYRARMVSPAALLARLPSDGAVVVSIDFKALRAAGVLSLLAASRVAQEPEYRTFVDQTGFDYLNDLDSALVSFHSTGTYLLLRGHFDWKALREYVVSQGGACYNSFCRVNGSTPERKISYFPLQRNVMGLAVSRDDYAASELQQRHRPVLAQVPREPIWSLIPVATLKNQASLPAGTRMFVRALEGANAVVFSAGPSGTGLAVSMEATCRDAATAYALTEQLRAATAQLRELIVRERQAPNPSDLSGVLVAGAFEHQAARVIGHWPVERAFLTNLAGGGF